MKNRLWYEKKRKSIRKLDTYAIECVHGFFNSIIWTTTLRFTISSDPPPSSKIYSITSLSESSTKMRVQIQSPRTIAKAEFILFEDYVATSSQEVEVYLSDSGYIVDVPACEGRCELVILGYGVDGTLVETGQAYVKLEGGCLPVLSHSYVSLSKERKKEKIFIILPSSFITCKGACRSGIISVVHSRPGCGRRRGGQGSRAGRFIPSSGSHLGKRSYN